MTDGILKTYLVTGGAGFIGSHFIENILGDGRSRVVNLDKLTYAGDMHNISYAAGNQNHIFIKGDICDKVLLNEIFNKYDIDYVVNFAAESHVDRSINDSAPFLKTNVQGVGILLDVIRKYWEGENDKLFLQISTDEVYGSIPDGVYADEEFPLNPGNPYSASKAAADLLVMSYYNTYRLPVIITRCCNNYGPRQHAEKFIPRMIDSLVNGGNISLYGKGINKREWIFVKDHCKVLTDVLQKGKTGKIYNIGSGYLCRNIDVAKDIIGFFNKFTGEAIDGSAITYIEDRKGHDMRYAMDCGRVKKLVRDDFVSDFKANLSKLVFSAINRT